MAGEAVSRSEVAQDRRRRVAARLGRFESEMAERERFELSMGQ